MHHFVLCRIIDRSSGPPWELSFPARIASFLCPYSILPSLFVCADCEALSTALAFKSQVDGRKDYEPDYALTYRGSLLHDILFWRSFVIQKRLGRSGLTVSPVCLGAMMFGD